MWTLQRLPHAGAFVEHLTYIISTKNILKKSRMFKFTIVDISYIFFSCEEVYSLWLIIFPNLQIRDRYIWHINWSDLHCLAGRDFHVSHDLCVRGLQTSVSISYSLLKRILCPKPPILIWYISLNIRYVIYKFFCFLF